MGERPNYQIKWGKKALKKYIEILDYIAKDSPANALRIRRRISEITSTLSTGPKIFRKDELKRVNNGSCRVFIKDNIRVSYNIKRDEIVITRVSHARQKPRFF